MAADDIGSARSLPGCDSFATTAGARALRDQAAFRTLFSTRHPFDAGMAGYDGPLDPCDGGFDVHFDGRGSVPTIVLNGSDGEISICGWAAIKMLTDACMDAEKMAARMIGRAA